MASITFDPIIGDVYAQVNQGQPGGFDTRHRVLTYAASRAGNAETTLTQISGPTASWTEEARVTDPLIGGNATVDGNFLIDTLAAGRYVFEATATDAFNSTSQQFSIFQNELDTLWGNNRIWAKDADYGNAVETTEANLGGSAYRSDGVDIQQTGRFQYVSHMTAGESLSFTAEVPDGDQTLKVQLATNAASVRDVLVYVDDVYQDTISFSRIGPADSSNWTEWQTLTADVNFGGPYNKVTLESANGSINVNSIQLA